MRLQIIARASTYLFVMAAESARLFISRHVVRHSELIS